jgi:hypothetical protein
MQYIQLYEKKSQKGPKNGPYCSQIFPKGTPIARDPRSIKGQKGKKRAKRANVKKRQKGKN